MMQELKKWGNASFGKRESLSLHLERNTHVHMAAFWLQGRHPRFVVDVN
jgi:hypothetical protein